MVFPRSLTGPQIVRALHAARVTVHIGVPRFYTALYAAIETRIHQRGRLATTLFHYALAGSIALRRRFGIYTGKWLFASLHKRLAPQERAVCSAGAAIEPDLAWKLVGLGWQTTGGYGLLEALAVGARGGFDADLWELLRREFYIYHATQHLHHTTFCHSCLQNL